MTGRLIGVGVGPGDPGLITRRAALEISGADVIAYHRSPSRSSIARGIAADVIAEGVIEEELVYPATTGQVNHSGGYYAAMADFYADCAERLDAHLRAGRTVAVLAEGDPLFYGSFMYVFDQLAARYPSEVVPGVSSMSAATAALGTGLCRHEDTLTVLPGTMRVPELARRLADTDAAVIMKLGRTFADVREAIHQAGLTDRAWYVERASSAAQRVSPIKDVDSASVPYMSIIVIPGLDRRADAAGRASADAAGQASASSQHLSSSQHVAGPSPRPTSSAGEPNASVGEQNTSPGTVWVVGLGPGGSAWLTPQAAEILSRVRHVVGYGPYVARVPQRAGLTRHVSGNTVELERARLALDLAVAGEQVAVVSGGDAGVFGMASAVFEAASDPRCAHVPIEVAPGVTAANAGAALAGAMLGADHALISLSDRLKPWSVIESRLRACMQTDLAVAIYNPRSRSRPDQLALALRVLLDMVGPDRVVAVARNVGRDGQALTVTTLRELDPATVDMSCVVLVGSSATRVTESGRVWTPRFVSEPVAASRS